MSKRIGSAVLVLLVAVGAFGLLAGTVAPGNALAAATGGPNPDPPPTPPPPPAPAPPPPPAPIAPPPPPAFVPPPPPPPAVVVHPNPVVRLHAAPKAKPPAPRPARVVDRPTNSHGVTLAAGAATSGSSNGSSGAMLLVLAGVLFAFLAIGLSRVPLSAVPTTIGSQFERNRQTILLTGLAIGLGCIVIAIFATLGGK